MHATTIMELSSARSSFLKRNTVRTTISRALSAFTVQTCFMIGARRFTAGSMFVGAKHDGVSGWMLAARTGRGRDLS